MRMPFAVLAALPLLLTGCKVGPNYKGPPAVAPNATKASTFTRAPQDVVSTSPAAARWWEPLSDPELNKLIETALARSPDIRVAEARLRESRAGLSGQRSNRLPASSASAAYLHAHLPSGSFGFGSIGLYNIGFDATWEADVV